jgi:hypothetical protein
VIANRALSVRSAKLTVFGSQLVKGTESGFNLQLKLHAKAIAVFPKKCSLEKIAILKPRMENRTLKVCGLKSQISRLSKH